MKKIFKLLPSMGVKTGESLIFLKKKKKKKKRIQIEHILQIIFVLIFSFLLI